MAAAASVRVARPGGSNSGDGPLTSTYVVNRRNTRPMYGLSEVFQVASDGATLSSLELKDDSGSAIALTPAFALGTTDYAGSVAPGVNEVTIIPTLTDNNAAYEVQDGSGTALVDVDSNEADFQVALSAGPKIIQVVVTAADSTTRTYSVVVTPPATAVAGDWSLIPAGLSTGDKFRLVFLSAAKRNGTSSAIADYNTFIQNRAAAGHADIRAYSSGFRVVGCTEGVDARINTGATYTSADLGVPIYWLNGARAANDYEDFYDRTWDDEANDKDEAGSNGLDTTQAANYPLTGCGHDGTEDFLGSVSLALGNGGDVRVGRPRTSGHGPLSSGYVTGQSNTRPMYGLSEVFEVGFDATLSGLELKDDGGSAITLAPAFAPGTTDYAASVETGADEVTIIPTVSDSNATYVVQDGSSTALEDADLNEAGFQVALSSGPNIIQVVVTASDNFTTQTYTVVVAPSATVVPFSWSLKPAGLSPGDKFRLLFLSSTKRDATSSDIADYNTFVQDRAAAGHLDIRVYSSGFRVVGCTEAVDARINTGTTYTNTDLGVPIYWLNGAKAADDYEDFYDGSWDEEANDKAESGADGPETSLEANHPFTGCVDDGTESVFNDISRALGRLNVRVARPGGSYSSDGPLSSTYVANRSNTRPMYGLSEVFEAPSHDATLSGLELKDDGGSAITLAPAFAQGTPGYTAPVEPGVNEVTIIPTVSDSNATYEVQDGSGTALVDADSNEADFQVALSAGVTTIQVVVTAPDGFTSRTYTVMIAPRDRRPLHVEPGPCRALPGRPVPAGVPVLDEAKRVVARHRGLQHLYPGPRGQWPPRHPGLQFGFRSGRLHPGRRCPRQHGHHLHQCGQGCPHLLAQRRQGR